MKRSNLSSLKRAAVKGDVQAQIALAAKLAVGDGIEQDQTHAARLYAAAAKQGSGEAAFNLATMYARGEGVRANWSKAKSLYTRAERLGSSDASVTLGELALRPDESSSADPIAALQHFALASLRGDARGLFLIASTLNEHPSLPVTKITEILYQACTDAGYREAKKALLQFRKRNG